MGNKAVIIYLNDGMLLSKKEYSCWEEIQDEYYEKYIANLEPMSCDETIFFFEDSFVQEENWPFSRKRIIEFFEKDEMIIQSDRKNDYNGF